MRLTPHQRQLLRATMDKHLNLDELKSLCFDLGINHENFPHDTKPQLMRGIIEYCEKSSTKLNDLLNYLKEHRHIDLLFLLELPQSEHNSEDSDEYPSFNELVIIPAFPHSADSDSSRLDNNPDNSGIDISRKNTDKTGFPETPSGPPVRESETPSADSNSLNDPQINTLHTPSSESDSPVLTPSSDNDKGTANPQPITTNNNSSFNSNSEQTSLDTVDLSSADTPIPHLGDASKESDHSAQLEPSVSSTSPSQPQNETLASLSIASPLNASESLGRRVTTVVSRFIRLTIISGVVIIILFCTLVAINSQQSRTTQNQTATSSAHTRRAQTQQTEVAKLTNTTIESQDEQGSATDTTSPNTSTTTFTATPSETPTPTAILTQSSTPTPESGTPTPPTSTNSPTPTPSFSATPPTLTPSFTPSATMPPLPTPIGGSGQIIFSRGTDFYWLDVTNTINQQQEIIEPLADHLEGSLPQGVTLSSCSWSGKQVVFSQGNTIYLVNRDGMVENKVVSGFVEVRWPTLNKEENKLAFSAKITEFDDYDVYTMDIDGTNLTNITAEQDGNNQNDTHPAWAPDATTPRTVDELIYESGNNEETNIFVVTFFNSSSDAPRYQNLTNGSNAVNTFPVWSPDGRRVAFASNRNGEEAIYVMNRNGGTALTLLYDPKVLVGGLTWSPDGKFIAFHSRGLNDNFDIYLLPSNISPNTPTPAQLTFSSEDDQSPSWCADIADSL